MVASIEFIEDTIAALDKATEANKSTPSREGNVIVLTPEVADEVMITADLHGHRRNFNRIKRIADLKNNPRRHLILQEVCHGGPTYPSNGGCMSHGMLEDVARLKSEYPDRVHFILSNHEMAELTEYPILKVGKMLNLMFRLGISEMYGPASERIREGYMNFIASCPVGVRVEASEAFICHSAPEKVDDRGFDATILDRDLSPTDMKEGTDLFQMVWGRDYRAENAKAFADLVGAKVLIHGHTPCEKGYDAPNDIQIILDCSSQPSCYLTLPVDKPLTQQEMIKKIEEL
ncbi:Metallophos domain-containing protein [Planctomycetales bacterium 10988]|nr:Metallophos domain-containing protein [Planctomycetales bacterium 10988]